METVAGGMLLTDDAAARLAGEILRYEVHGSIGIILRSLRRGLRTKRQVLNLLRAIPAQSTFFVSDALLSSVIEDVTKS
jgi:predicted nucleic acid-binding protein